MHEKYAKDGLVCMSVSMDEKDQRATALKFLEQKKATFSNYLLDEPGEVWEAKLGATAPPTVLIFDRDGKRVKKFTAPVSYAEVEKAVIEVLNRG